jgi:hypothetical protein
MSAGALESRGQRTHRQDAGQVALVFGGSMKIPQWIDLILGGSDGCKLKGGRRTIRPDQ